MPLQIIVGDIYAQKVDAIVNDVPPSDSCIKQYGYLKISSAHTSPEDASDCMPMKKSLCRADKQIFITGYYWKDDTISSRKKLQQCYCDVLKIAEENRVRSIAFPLMGVTAWGYPLNIAGKLAVLAINEWLAENNSSMKVYLIITSEQAECFDKLSDRSLNILRRDDTDSKGFFLGNSPENQTTDSEKSRYAVYGQNLKEAVAQSGLASAEYYERYVRDLLRCRIFSEEEMARRIKYDKGGLNKYKNGHIQKPARHRVIALAIAMELSDEERYRFINCAGHFYPKDKRDFLIEEMMQAGIRDFESINKALGEIDNGFLLNTYLNEQYLK